MRGGRVQFRWCGAGVRQRSNCRVRRGVSLTNDATPAQCQCVISIFNQFSIIDIGHICRGTSRRLHIDLFKCNVRLGVYTWAVNSVTLANLSPSLCRLSSASFYFDPLISHIMTLLYDCNNNKSHLGTKVFFMISIEGTNNSCDWW